MGIKFADVIVDCQSGDTGKGKIANELARSGFYDIVLRYNGGSNAGHTVYHNGKKIVTHQVPVGVLHGVIGVIGPGCVVNLRKLEEEIKELNQAGVNTHNLIWIDKRAHVVFDYHVELDGADERIGTTKQGIGPAYVSKYGRTGVRMEDLEYEWDAKSLPYKIIDIYELLHEDLNEYRILCEGAQGFNLDIDWGDYPFVTSSHCTVGSVCLNGIPPRAIRQVFGVIKAYETYVGNNLSFTDQNDETFKRIQQVGNEFGATTGRPRMVNWININKVLQAININGVTKLFVNKGDVLRDVGTYKIRYDDAIIEYPEYELFKKALTNIFTRNRKELLYIQWSESPEKI